MIKRGFRNGSVCLYKYVLLGAVEYFVKAKTSIDGLVDEIKNLLEST